MVSSYTADSKPVKQEVNCTVILPPLVFPGLIVSKAFMSINIKSLNKCLRRQLYSLGVVFNCSFKNKMKIILILDRLAL